MSTMNLNSLLEGLEAGSGIEKKAAAAAQTQKPAISSDLAGILEKKASNDLSTKAFSAGEELAKQLLQKVANEIQEGNNVMVASDNQKVVPTETATTVEGVLDSSLAQGVANGAVIGDRVDDITDGKSPAEVSAISVTENRETPATTDPQLTNKENEMSKTAQENKTLAEQIMEKLAQDLSPVVTDASADASLAGGANTVPNKIQQDNAVMSAQSDAYTQGVGPVPGDGTVDSLFQAIVARAESQGAGHPDIVAGDAPVPRDTLPEAVEKAAAVSALCDAGLDFESAVELVKQAEEQLNVEAWEQEKVACVEALIAEGIDFDSAVALTKQAEEDLIEKEAMSPRAAQLLGAGKFEALMAKDALKAGAGKVMKGLRSAGKAAKGAAAHGATYAQLQGLRAKDGIAAAAKSGKKLANTAKAKAVQLANAAQLEGHMADAAIKANPYKAMAGAGAAGLAAGGAAGYIAHEKKACLEELMSEGFDFDTAVELTKQASIDVYGE